MGFDEFGVRRKTPAKYPSVDSAIKAKGSVMDFIRISGVNQQTYYAMQAGRTIPTLGLILKVLDYTGMDFDTAFREGRINAQ